MLPLQLIPSLGQLLDLKQLSKAYIACPMVVWMVVRACTPFFSSQVIELLSFLDKLPKASSHIGFLWGRTSSCPNGFMNCFYLYVFKNT